MDGVDGFSLWVEIRRSLGVKFSEHCLQLSDFNILRKMVLLSLLKENSTPAGWLGLKFKFVLYILERAGHLWVSKFVL